MRTSKLVVVLGLFSFGIIALSSFQSSEWVVPAKYQKMTNPTDAEDEEGLSIGKDLYNKHCKSCHGKEGLGDGTKAAEVKGDLGDFSSAKFQKQSDGALFYKSRIGRDDMPNYEKKIPIEFNLKNFSELCGPTTNFSGIENGYGLFPDSSIRKQHPECGSWGEIEYKSGNIRKKYFV